MYNNVQTLTMKGLYMIKIGMKHEEKTVVSDENTAAAVGSGQQRVFATPAMIMLMEKSAMNNVGGYLEPGQATVGTMLTVKHVAATPVGMAVRAVSELVEYEKRRLLFKVTAYDEQEMIGEGTHERFIIDVERFMEKCDAKLK